jgi:hypothetical protein
MQVFVSWAYEAEWIEDYAIPIIKSYGVEVITGKELEGQVITDGVKKLIKDSDAVVAFTTRREQNGQSWKTSDWVVDEIQYANALEKTRIFEVREEGVDYPNKINNERQYLIFPTDDRLACLRDLAKVISRWTVMSVKLNLMPVEFISDIRTRLQNKKYRCKYTITRRGEVLYERDNTRISREGAGLCIYVNDLPAEIFTFPDAQIEVEVEAGDKWWTATRYLSSYEVALENF